MGAIWFNQSELLSTLSEIVGFKTGLALTFEELSKHVPPHFREIWEHPPVHVIRIRSEEFEELVLAVMYNLGAIESPHIGLPGLATTKVFGDNEETLKVLGDIIKRWSSYYDAAANDAKRAGLKSIDPMPFLEAIRTEHGDRAAVMAATLLLEMQKTLERSPWSQFRSIDYQDTLELQKLFNSESLEAAYGNFIDQRFIDYLAKNFSKIGEIHWRQFEAIVAEFFDREGFHVKLGTGRSDGGIDIRVWPKSDDATRPPVILIQCKRHKDKIGSMVVKALWADVINEEASSGLIVTTSALSPDAKNVASARGYPIEEADREKVREWIERMRTPSTGVFMGE